MIYQKEIQRRCDLVNKILENCEEGDVMGCEDYIFEDLIEEDDSIA